jgi:hypothetical protein
MTRDASRVAPFTCLGFACLRSYRARLSTRKRLPPARTRRSRRVRRVPKNAWDGPAHAPSVEDSADRTRADADARAAAGGRRAPTGRRVCRASRVSAGRPGRPVRAWSPLHARAGPPYIRYIYILYVCIEREIARAGPPATGRYGRGLRWLRWQRRQRHDSIVARP